MIFLELSANQNVRLLVWLYTLLGYFNFGPSGVHALPFAAGKNKGGHYFRYFSSCWGWGCGYQRYSKPQKGLSQGFKFLRGLLKKNSASADSGPGSPSAHT
jgi:hypothetical protein